MKFTKSYPKALIVGSVTFILIGFFMLGTVYADCRCGNCCPDHRIALFTNHEFYNQGEPVEVIFSNPKNYQVTFERLYISRGNPSNWFSGGTVYSHEFSGGSTIQGSSWTWTWNQRGNDGSRVPPGEYILVIETQSCGSYQTCFVISSPSQQDCEVKCYMCCSCSCQRPPSVEAKCPDYFMKYFVSPIQYEDDKVKLRLKEHVRNELSKMTDSISFREVPENTVVWSENGVFGWRNDALSELGLSLEPSTGTITGYLTNSDIGEYKKHNYFFYIEALNSQGEVLAGIWVEIALT